MKYIVNGPIPREGYTAEMPGITLHGGSPREVLTQWAKREMEAGRMLPPGWEARVWEALLLNHPRHIRRIGGAKAPGVGVASALSFLKFMAKRVTNSSLVSPEEARRRAAICSSCPLAAPIVGCSVCRDVLQLTIRPPEALAVPAACGACGCVLDLKCWVPRDQLGSADAFPYQESCWMREHDPDGTSE